MHIKQFHLLWTNTLSEKFRTCKLCGSYTFKGRAFHIPQGTSLMVLNFRYISYYSISFRMQYSKTNFSKLINYAIKSLKIWNVLRIICHTLCCFTSLWAQKWYSKRYKSTLQSLKCLFASCEPKIPTFII